MRLGILITSIGNFGKKGFYNSQEVGLGRNLANRGYEVDIYKCTDEEEDTYNDDIESSLKIHYIHTKKIGNNAVFNCQMIDKTIDALIYFSDIQLSVKNIYNWTKKNNIIFIPYIGIAESTSTNKFVSILMKISANIAYKVYKSNGALVKTSYVMRELGAKGINNTIVAPVGIDCSLLNTKYKEADKNSIRTKFNLTNNDKVLLLVGRLENDRKPMDCISVFKKLYEYDQSFKLLVIGQGSLKDIFLSKIKEMGLYNSVRYISKLKNSDMWEAYKISDFMINFSRTEIFGMSILEAMFYETPVIAMSAPGPDDIIDNGVCGFICKTIDEIVTVILTSKDKNIGVKAHNKVLKCFTWDKTTNIIEKCIIQGGIKNVII